MWYRWPIFCQFQRFFLIDKVPQFSINIFWRNGLLIRQARWPFIQKLSCPISINIRCYWEINRRLYLKCLQGQFPTVANSLCSVGYLWFLGWYRTVVVEHHVLSIQQLLQARLLFVLSFDWTSIFDRLSRNWSIFSQLMWLKVVLFWAYNLWLWPFTFERKISYVLQRFSRWLSRTLPMQIFRIAPCCWPRCRPNLFSNHNLGLIRRWVVRILLIFFDS